MDWSLVLSIGAIIVGPLSGVLVAVIANHRSKKTEDAQVDVQKDANSNQLVSVLIEGFTEQVRLVNASNEGLRLQVKALEDKNNQLEKRLDERDALKIIMLAHIGELEKMIPTPPGPPKRPF
jgi:hypothetical protein